MTPSDHLIDQAQRLLADKHVTVCDKAGLSLSLAEFGTAKDGVIALQARLAEVARGITAAIDDPASPVAGHAFDDDHYSKVITCGTLARYRNAATRLTASIATAEEGRITLHRSAA